MGLFEHFPYTNFHELNLSWFLDTFRELLTEWEEQKVEFQNLKDAWEAMRTWITEYFDNLDVQEEINNKLDQMLADGSLESIFNDVIPGVIVNWMDENITVDSPVVDRSLSVPDAAADAKVTGDRINSIADLTDYSPYYKLELGGINGSGEEFGASDGTYMRSAYYIPMTEARYMQFPSKGDPTGKALYICYYNSSLVFQSRVQTTTGMAIDTSYPFIRLSFYYSGGNDEDMYRSWIDWNIPVTIVDTVNGMNEDITNIGNELKDIENLDDIHPTYDLENGGINSSGVEFGEQDGTYMRTPEYIPMETAQYMEFPSKGDPTGKALFICYYNSNKVFQSRVQTTVGMQLDTQYAYIRMSFYYSGGNDEDMYRRWVIWNVPTALVNAVRENLHLFKYNYNAASKTLTITGTKARYVVKRCVDSDINLDSWRLYSGDIMVNGSWSNMWTNSDAEGPIKIDNEADFISGFHGDEVYDNVSLLIDNSAIDLSSDAEGSGESFMLLQESTVYRAGTTTPAFTRYKKVSIRENNFNVQQRWVALVACTVTTGALCIMQCYDTDLISWDTDILQPIQPYTQSAVLDPATRVGNLYLNGGRKLSLVALVGWDNQYYYPTANYYSGQQRVKYYFYMYNGKTLSAGDELISKFSVLIDDYMM